MLDLNLSQIGNCEEPQETFVSVYLVQPLSSASLRTEMLGASPPQFSCQVLGRKGNHPRHCGEKTRADS